jgi:hypothetical protein
MNNILKNILIVILTSLAMFSSLMIHIYNTTIDCNGSVGSPLSPDEIVMYDMYIYILCISTLLLGAYWCYKQSDNTN